MDAPFVLLPTRVPAGNIRVPEADFEQLYTELMAWHDDPHRPFDAYVLGVERTLAWLAHRAVVEDGKSVVPRTPLSEEYHSAEPETITEEYMFAIEQFARGGQHGNDYTAGVIAALDWAWNGEKLPPLTAGWLAALYSGHAPSAR